MEIPESDEVQTLQADLASKQEECEELKRKLDVEIASNTQQSDEWEDKSEEMTTKITHLEQQLSRSEYRLKITEAAISDQEQGKQALLQQNKEESAARTKAEEENATLKSKLMAHEDKLKASKDELKIVRGENKNLTKDLATVRESNEVGIEACQDEIRQLKETVQGLTKERDERDAKIQEYHAQLGKQLAQNTLLDDRIASLEQTRVQLEASIVSCWMHSFWAWTTRFKGRRGKPQLVEGNLELKTYA
ncbi:hypothetical protein BHE90_001217 [Fusarium euwallaceae]|uniref:Uncharacterized protein n=1 Tax=Fusarium euwallaceae TaxID=1147111 RepID=A0A430M8B7_9HYPO|nr:hypothetical protein BHE90_001217 [Fusarium euwallaceae]